MLTHLICIYGSAGISGNAPTDEEETAAAAAGCEGILRIFRAVEKAGHNVPCQTRQRPVQ